MFSRNRTSKPEPTPEELREKALDRLHTTAVSGRVDLLGPVVSQGRLKLTEVKGAERAHRFAELFNHLAAQARQTAS